MKLLLIMIVAAGIYSALNWEMISSKLEGEIDRVTEMKDEGDDLSETMKNKFDDAKKQISDAQEKMDKARESLDELIDKVK